jgi:ubiquitin-activating enzyme E1
MAEATANVTLDSKALNKFSRQIAALGADVTAKLLKMKIVIVGLRGVGIEACKNLSLQGIGGITLIDSNPVELKDVGVNFFFTEDDIGKNRASVTLPKLRELNPVCSLNIAHSLDEIDFKKIGALVITQILDLQTLISLNERCRENRVSFFYSFIGGLAADIFVDHGCDHIIFDANGEKPVQKLITSIVAVSDKEVKIRYEAPEGQQAISIDKGFYEITEVEGIGSLNGKVVEVIIGDSDPVKTIRVTDSITVTINESPTNGNSPIRINKTPIAVGEGEQYLKGGLLTEKKVAELSPMMSFAQKLRDAGDPWAVPPTTVQTDYFGSEFQQHVAFYAVHAFYGIQRRLPSVRSAEDLATVRKIADDLVTSKSVTAPDDWEINEEYFKKYVSLCGVELQALSAFAGGVLAQEVVKCTGKFTPIPGWLHFSSFESLPADDQVPTAEDSRPRHDARDELAAVYGWSFVEKLGNLRYFLVGSGALGCEFLKNFALNNICAGPEGKLYVTDADRIELSNLARQFLFREHNVGQPKSRAAAAMAKQMNPQFKVESLEVFVGPKTEDIFHDDFWIALDGVCNALDNIEARLYVDQQCVRYEKPLLESGTMGTSGNVDTIVPHKTRTYGEGGEAAEGMGVPMCTLRNFPHLPDHCIEWARDIFELLFVKLGKNLESYLNNADVFIENVRDKAGSEPGAAYFDVRALTAYARFIANPSIGAAAQCAYDLFHFLFRDRILDLQNTFPADCRIVDKDTGADKGPFWNEKKRYPTVAVFSTETADHFEFMRSATILLGVTAGILPAKTDAIDEEHYLTEYRTENAWLLHILSGLNVPEYVPAPVSTAGTDDATPNAAASSAAFEEEKERKLSQMIQNLSIVSESLRANIETTPVTIETASFEKDDDANMHIAFITATSNARCANYSIRAVDFHECKVIAGKIIAAIATTTAAVCGLVMLELFKVVLGKGTDDFMNRNIGLAGNKYTSFSADAPVKYKTKAESIAPDVTESLPADAYDEKGKVKAEYYETRVQRAYPEGHSIWDKLTISADLSLKDFARWLDQEHGLLLDSWNFIYGYRTVSSDSKKASIGVTAKIYPPAPVLDDSLLPALELSLAQATQALMRNVATRPQLQAYLALWKQKVSSNNNTDAGDNSPNNTHNNSAVSEHTTLREILQQMCRLGEEGVAQGKLESMTVSHIAQRKFVVLPGKETPSCTWKETGESVEYLAALKIVL